MPWFLSLRTPPKCGRSSPQTQSALFCLKFKELENVDLSCLKKPHLALFSVFTHSATCDSNLVSNQEDDDETKSTAQSGKDQVGSVNILLALPKAVSKPALLLSHEILVGARISTQ